MSSRPPFRPVAAPLDVDDTVLRELNQKLHVPTLVKARSVEAESQPQPSPPPRPVDEGEQRQAESQAPLRKDVRLAVEVPEYLRDAVNLRAARERGTARHIVMQGLQAIGFEIDPADLVVDGRQSVAKR